MREQIQPIKLVAMDVDGVLTHGDVNYTDARGEIKTFNIKDGLGIAVASHANLQVAIISGRESAALEQRVAELKIAHLSTGCRDKGGALRRLIGELGLSRDQVAFIGDDINDIPAFRESGFRVAVQDASEDLKAQADYVTQRPGGSGAVREVIEMILKVQGKWADGVESFLQHLQQPEGS